VVLGFGDGERHGEDAHNLALLSATEFLGANLSHM